MEEIKKTEEKAEEQKPSMISEAHSAAEKLRIENERMERNIKQLQELKAFETLGGRSEGRTQEVPKPEISPSDYSKLVLAGKLPVK